MLSAARFLSQSDDLLARPRVTHSRASRPPKQSLSVSLCAEIVCELMVNYCAKGGALAMRRRAASETRPGRGLSLALSLRADNELCCVCVFLLVFIWQCEERALN